MRTLPAIIAALLAVGGCVEYDVVPDPPEYTALPNPPPVEATLRTETWTQGMQPVVDVLFVVDNSGTMAEEQTALATNFPVFMDYLLGSGLNYHVGVVTTDMANINQRGRLRVANGVSYITPTTPNAVGTLQQMVSLGTWGSGEERGRDAAWTAIEDTALNPGFYRPYARALHLVFVTDENDSSYTVSTGEFLQWMGSLHPQVTAHAIVGLPGNCATSMAGYSYLSYVSATGGVLWDICDPDWAPVMDEMGIQVAGLPREFFLAGHPRDGTLAVTVTWQESDGLVTAGRVVCDAGYETDDCDVVYNRSRNSLVFGSAPFQHDTITATYEDAAGE